MSKINWNDKQQVLAAVKEDGIALKFASAELKNDKEVVLDAVKQDGNSLQFSSEKLKNDFEMLILLKRYHIDNNINDYGEKYQNWYNERMTILDTLNEQLYLEKNISNNPSQAKTRKF